MTAVGFLGPFDDEQRVYIQMPATLQATDALALLVQSCGGESALVNYQYGFRTT